MAKLVPPVAVVIATNRSDAFKEWIGTWKHELHDAMLYVVEDQPHKTENDVKFACHVVGARHYTWDDIDADLGENSWIIPRCSSAVKSYGFLKAYQGGAEVIWTLDDDCFPDPQYSGTYLQHITGCLHDEVEDPAWYNTIGYTGLYPRGYPYGIRQQVRPVKVHHGLWSNIPDLDGITALEWADFRMITAKDSVETVPRGQMFPMCGMNLAFRREMTPAMYFMLQGRVRDTAFDGQLGPEPATNPLPFDRFDDIWAGLFAKKVTDHLGYAVTSGAPSIVHTKLSDPTMRVLKEAPGIAAHEILWKHVANWSMRDASTVKEAYEVLANCVYHAQREPVLKQWDSYWVRLANAMNTWAGMF